MVGDLVFILSILSAFVLLGMLVPAPRLFLRLRNPEPKRPLSTTLHSLSTGALAGFTFALAAAGSLPLIGYGYAIFLETAVMELNVHAALAALVLSVVSGFVYAALLFAQAIDLAAERPLRFPRLHVFGVVHVGGVALMLLASNFIGMDFLYVLFVPMWVVGTLATLALYGASGESTPAKPSQPMRPPEAS